MDYGEAIQEEKNKIKEIIYNIREKYEEKFVKRSLELLNILLKNILDHPDEEKYKRIKKTNEQIQYKILFITEFYELLYLLGYEELNSEFLIFKGNKFSLQRAIEILSANIDDIEKILKQKEIEREEKERKKIDDENLKFIQERLEEERKKQEEKLKQKNKENENNFY